jgi:hypothetical protein
MTLFKNKLNSDEQYDNTCSVHVIVQCNIQNLAYSSKMLHYKVNWEIYNKIYNLLCLSIR